MATAVLPVPGGIHNNLYFSFLKPSTNSDECLSVESSVQSIGYFGILIFLLSIGVQSRFGAFFFASRGFILANFSASACSRSAFILARFFAAKTPKLLYFFAINFLNPLLVKF